MTGCSGSGSAGFGRIGPVWSDSGIQKTKSKKKKKKERGDEENQAVADSYNLFPEQEINEHHNRNIHEQKIQDPES